MELTTAVRLIEKGVSKKSPAQVWADLGAGDGLFTHALGTLIPPSSRIYAIDKRVIELNFSITQIELISLTLDFVEDELIIEPLDGIVLANAIHFVQDKISLLKKLRHTLKPDGRIILIEYDITLGNSWVPYPMNYDSLAALSREVGLKEVKRLGDVPSLYHKNIYAALLLV